MKYDIYGKLIEHVRSRNWVDATEVFRAILEQKVALRLESEKQLLQEPDEVEEDADPTNGNPLSKADDAVVAEAGKKDEWEAEYYCKNCGKKFTPSYGEYSRCKDCLGKQTDAGERATAGRY